MAIHIGTSGWSYEHWEGVLYPQQLLPRLRLDYYIQHYHTVEVNSTYYRWPSDSTFASWRQRLPTGFLMSVKAPRGLTPITSIRVSTPTPTCTGGQVVCVSGKNWGTACSSTSTTMGVETRF